MKKTLELWCDVDYCVNWRPATTHIAHTTPKSRTEFVLKYAG